MVGYWHRAPSTRSVVFSARKKQGASCESHGKEANRCEHGDSHWQRPTIERLGFMRSDDSAPHAPTALPRRAGNQMSRDAASIAAGTATAKQHNAVSGPNLAHNTPNTAAAM